MASCASAAAARSLAANEAAFSAYSTASNTTSVVVVVADEDGDEDDCNADSKTSCLAKTALLALASSACRLATPTLASAAATPTFDPTSSAHMPLRTSSNCLSSGTDCHHAEKIASATNEPEPGEEELPSPLCIQGIVVVVVVCLCRRGHRASVLFLPTHTTSFIQNASSRFLVATVAPAIGTATIRGIVIIAIIWALPSQSLPPQSLPLSLLEPFLLPLSGLLRLHAHCLLLSASPRDRAFFSKINPPPCFCSLCFGCSGISSSAREACSPPSPLPAPADAAASVANEVLLPEDAECGGGSGSGACITAWHSSDAGNGVSAVVAGCALSFTEPRPPPFSLLLLLLLSSLGPTLPFDMPKYVKRRRPAAVVVAGVAADSGPLPFVAWVASSPPRRRRG